jgi:uncharacterized protein YdcH (DUF465 family)
MDVNTSELIKEYLVNNDPVFRELVKEHGRYESRLSELSALTYPNDEEQLEEITLKKKKLAIKDQMYEMMLNFEKEQGTAH